MRQTLKGNGHGADSQIKKTAPAPVLSAPIDKESPVSFQTAESVKLRGMLSRVTRHLAVFELFSPAVTPRFSEVLTGFTIVMQSRAVYSGRAVVSKVLDAGTKIICEAMLEEAHWKDIDFLLLAKDHPQIENEFRNFLKGWQTLYRVQPEFKVVVADLQTFFDDLRLWLDKFELGIRNFAQPLRRQLETEIVEKLSKPICETIDTFVVRFESITAKLPEEMHPIHRSFFRRQLHPFILTSPFAQRAYHKPLGYAGDYKMIEMMMESPYQGETLFAKVINVWLLGQLLVKAHLNRIARLEEKIVAETVRARNKERRAKILNIGCGPAFEVSHFYETRHIYASADFTLLDFNEETLNFLRDKLTGICQTLDEPASFSFIKKSVTQIIKDRGESLRHQAGEGYDYIYCAGLYDYLSDNVSKALMNIFYELLAPEGLVMITNAADDCQSSKPFRYSMDYMLDWNLLYRGREELADLAPDHADPANVKVIIEDTGTNMFLEVRKPKDG
ncbi:MAG: class I SAM-dependent methyltransferase [Limisphaerales bacterium]